MREKLASYFAHCRHLNRHLAYQMEITDRLVVGGGTRGRGGTSGGGSEADRANQKRLRIQVELAGVLDAAWVTKVPFFYAPSGLEDRDKSKQNKKRNKHKHKNKNKNNNGADADTDTEDRLVEEVECEMVAPAPVPAEAVREITQPWSEKATFIAGLASGLVHTAFPPGEVIYSEGEDANCMYIIRRGIVRKRQTLLATGQYFGAEMICYGAVREETAAAMSFADCVLLPYRHLLVTLYG
jgi:hypothetical protein